MNQMINTNGADIHVLDRPGGGWVIRQGKSHLLLTAREAVELRHVLKNRTDPVISEPPIARKRDDMTAPNATGQFAFCIATTV